MTEKVSGQLASSYVVGCPGGEDVPTIKARIWADVAGWARGADHMGGSSFLWYPEEAGKGLGKCFLYHEVTSKNGSQVQTTEAENGT